MTCSRVNLLSLQIFWLLNADVYELDLSVVFGKGKNLRADGYILLSNTHSASLQPKHVVEK